MSNGNKTERVDLVAKSALLFGAGTLTSRILGLIRDGLIFALLPKDIRDAWLAAWRVPNFFRRIFGEGGLSVSFIPIYVESIERGRPEDLKNLINGIYSLLITLSGFICFVCYVFMEPLIHFWLSGPGFTDIPGKMDQTIEMARIMIFFLFFIILFAYFMALLNGRKKFTLTGFAPMLLNISIIGGLWWFQDSQQLALVAAWSVVVGGALQALILIPALQRIGPLPRFKIKKANPDSNKMVKKVILRFVPTFFAVGTLQILNMVNVYFSAQLESGTVGYFYMADRLLELPLSLIAVSIGTALLPTLSSYWSKGEGEKFKECIGKHLRLFYFLALPSALGLWFIGVDIVEILFKRGEFLQSDVPIVAGILKVYCLTLLCAGSLKIFNQAFYAIGDTVTPALISVAGLIVHLILAPWLMAQFQINGLALSTALITAFNFVLGVYFLQKKVGSLRWSPIISHFAKILLAAIFMSSYLWALNQWKWQQGRFLVDFPLLLVFVGVAGGLFFFAASILKIEEMVILRKKILKR